MPAEKQTVQLAVIGAGPGGYAAAFRAADLGMKVTLIDGDMNPGGVCLYRGCIPSKALLHVAKVVNDARKAKEWGVTFSEPEIDIKKIQSWKEGVVQKLTSGLGQLAKQRKVNFIQGKASFVDSKTLQITKEDKSEIHLTFDNCILASGSRPSPFPGAHIDSSHLLYSSEALCLKEMPKRLLVIGGGYIGLELGSVYAAFGSQVSVVEITSNLLPGVDRDLVLPLSRQISQSFESVMLETKVSEIKEDKNGLKVVLEGKDGKKEEVFNKVLVSIGRKPNSDQLNLEKTKVKIDEKGFVQVNGQCQTTEPNIYAIGDLVGEPMLAHKASHEARVAVESIAGQKVAFEPQAIPAVVFTDPEIAWCGLTENQAKKEKRSVKVVRFPWAASGRALTLGRSDGVTKLIIDSENEAVLGVGISGSGAGELIAEAVLAIEMGVTVSDLKLSIHPHPTLSETLMEAAEVFFGQSVHLYSIKR